MRYTLFGPDIVVVVFLDGGSSSPSCKCKQLLVLVQKRKREKKCTKGSRCNMSRALAPVISYPCSRPSGGVVTWQSLEVWVIGGGTRRGGVVSVWCGMVSGPKQRVVWVPSS